MKLHHHHNHICPFPQKDILRSGDLSWSRGHGHDYEFVSTAVNFTETLQPRMNPISASDR